MAILNPSIDRITSLLECTICQNILSDPVILCSNQHTADRLCATQWFLKNPSCPECREQIDPKKPLNSNRLVVQLLAACRIAHLPVLQQQAPVVLDTSPLITLLNANEANSPAITFEPSAPPMKPKELPSQTTSAETSALNNNTVSKVASNSDRMNISAKRAASPQEDLPLPRTITLSFIPQDRDNFLLLSSTVSNEISETAATRAGVALQKVIKELNWKEDRINRNIFNTCQLIEGNLTQIADNSKRAQLGEPDYEMILSIIIFRSGCDSKQGIIKVILNYRFVKALSGVKNKRFQPASTSSPIAPSQISPAHLK